MLVINNGCAFYCITFTPRLCCGRYESVIHIDDDAVTLTNSSIPQSLTMNFISQERCQSDGLYIFELPKRLHCFFDVGDLRTWSVLEKQSHVHLVVHKKDRILGDLLKLYALADKLTH